MLGIDASGTIAGIEILSHAETPGLGDKIAFSIVQGDLRR